MARRRENRLVPINIARQLQPGMHPDGNGLYLRVSDSGAKSWILRYKVNGKRHDMGLGPFPIINLAEARKRAQACRRQKVDGEDPLQLRKQVAQLAAAKRMTFRECAEVFSPHSLNRIHHVLLLSEKSVA